MERLRLKSVAIFGTIFGLVFIASFLLSGQSYPTLGLDQSWKAVIEYASLHHWRFGQDIVFTYGPLGYLHSEVSQGALLFQRTVFALLWSALVVFSTIFLSARMTPFPRILFLLWFLFFSCFGLLEQHLYMVLLCLTAYLLGEKRSLWLTVPVFIMLGVIALIKFTFFLAVIATLGCVVIAHLLLREVKTGILLAAGAICSVATVWVLSGQSIADLLPWIVRSFDIASGYSLAMSVVPKYSVFIAGLAVLLFFATTTGYVAIRQKRNVSSMFLLTAVSLYMFLIWKHSFVRADGHTMFLFWSLPLLFPVFFLVVGRDAQTVSQRRILSACYVAIITLCIVGLELSENNVISVKLHNWPEAMLVRARQIRSVLTLSAEQQYTAHQPAKNESHLPALLPKLSSIVGRDSVDVMNYSQWAALANNLNYLPRPVVQGYSAYTPSLQDMNLAHFEGANAPQYVLMDLDSIDHRFRAVDDGPSFLHVLLNYRIVAEEKNYILMKKQQSVPLKLQLFHEQTIRFGEQLDLNRWNSDLVVAEVFFKTTLWGKLNNFLFQTSPVLLEAETGTDYKRYRFIPSMTERPFLLSPIIYNNAEISALHMGKLPNIIRAIQFGISPWTVGQYQDAITVKLYHYL